MSNLTELTAQIIAARAAKKDMSKEELQQEMQMVYSFLKGIETGDVPAPVQEAPVEEAKPQLTIKQAFKKDEVICMICNKGFKTLKKHLTLAHQMTDKEYKAQFNIPAKQALVAKSYSDQKKAFALENKLGDKMQAGRKAKIDIASGELFEAALPVVEVIAPVPVKKSTKPKVTVPTKVAKKK